MELLMQTPTTGSHKPVRSGLRSRKDRPALALATPPEAGVHDLRTAALRQAEQGRIGDGLMMLREVLDQEPRSHAVVSDIAALLMMARQHELAAHYALDALSLKPDHGPSLYVLGFALSGLGDVGRAQEALAQLIVGPAHDSLVLEAPALLPLVQIELRRLAAMPH
jgi:predicted Zn-dependent protease